MLIGTFINKIKISPILMLFILVNKSLADVFVEEINITTEFCSVISKTKVEFIIRNNSDLNNFQQIIDIDINKTAIVTDLWLEINGELKIAETLSLETGSRIYDRITRKRIDPALMIKRENGKYSLRVFPVNAHEKRRVIIEYYSILEGDSASGVIWKFHSPSLIKNIEITGSIPNCRSIVVNGDQCEITDDRWVIKKSFGKSDIISVSLNCDFIKPVKLCGNDNTFYLTDKKNHCANLISNRSDKVPDFLTSLIGQINKYGFVSVQRRGKDEFLDSFLNYLGRRGMVELSFNIDSWNWYKHDTGWIYKTYSFTLNQTLASDAAIEVIECPYIDIFCKYNKSLNQSLDQRKTLGYLSGDLSKLVIEDDERAKSIRKEELINEYIKEETDLDVGDIPPPPPGEGRLSRIIHYDNPPQPIGGFQAIHDKVFYPEFAIKQKIEGTVVLQCLISEKGKATDIVILRSVHPVLDFCSILALGEVDWIPAKSRDKPVAVWIAVPIIFKLNDHKNIFNFRNKKSQINNKEYALYEKTFIIDSKKNKLVFFEREFNKKGCVEYKYGSDQLYQLLFDNPSLIKYVYKILYIYKLNSLGLVDRGKSILIIR